MNNRRRNIYCFLFIIIGVLTVLCGCGKRVESNIAGVELMDGDIVFRRGRGTKTRAVMYVDKQGSYSHVGMIIKTDSANIVVHVTPGEREVHQNRDIIKIDRVEQFFDKDKAEAGAVMRLHENRECIEAAVKEALRLWGKSVEFDHDYKLDDSIKYYCTELIWHIYKVAGIDITSGRRSELYDVPMYKGTYILPSDIYKDSSFSIVYKY